MQLDFAHFERRRMIVAHQVANQALIVSQFLGPCAVRNPGSLNDGLVVSHIVDDADKTVVQNGMRLI